MKLISKEDMDMQNIFLKNYSLDEINIKELEQKLHENKIRYKRYLYELRFYPGICLDCGCHFDVLTHYHAQSHGYKDAYEMIKKHRVYFDFQR